MGTFFQSVTLFGPERSVSEQFGALVDTGATYSLIPQERLSACGIVATDSMEFTTADTRTITLPIGQAEIEVEGRSTVTWVIFAETGTVPLLGAYALEGLRFAADPFNRRLVPLRGFLTTSD